MVKCADQGKSRTISLQGSLLALLSACSVRLLRHDLVLVWQTRPGPLLFSDKKRQSIQPAAFLKREKRLNEQALLDDRCLSHRSILSLRFRPGFTLH